MQPADLVEIHAIERLKYTYLRCLDQKLWDELEGCFTEDATASYGGGAAVFNDRAGIMDFLRTAMGSTSMLTSHKCHHPEIDLTGPDTATGVWALEDVVVLVDGDGGLPTRGAASSPNPNLRVGVSGASSTPASNAPIGRPVPRGFSPAGAPPTLLLGGGAPALGGLFSSRPGPRHHEGRGGGGGGGGWVN